MRGGRDTRRSTSALLEDENEKLVEAILDQHPLLGYIDIDDPNGRPAWYRRIFARYGSIVVSLSLCLNCLRLAF